MFRPLCDHIVYALYEVDVLHIGLNELSAGLDTVFVFDILIFFLHDSDSQ